MIFLFLFLAICNCYLAIQGRELKFVQAIWRHGDRAPSKLSYPNNPYNESYWPRGWNQLTNIGMQQLYELGQFFRRRYAGNFTSAKFNIDEVYVRSSSSDRALTSAQSMLYGFFPAVDEEQWDSCINWQPIPIHADTPEDQDPLLKPTSLDCPTYDKTYDKIEKHLFKNLTETYEPLLQFLSNLTGFGPEITLDQALHLNNINRELTHNLTQPDWVYKTWPEFQNKTTLEIITELYAITRLSKFNTEKLYYIRGGYVLGDFMKRVQNVANGVQKEPSKMALYSAHDGTLLSLMYAMQVADNQTIPYAATIIMEIWQNDDGLFVVELYYRKNRALVLLTVPGCTSSCPVDQFYDLLKQNAIFDEKKLFKKCGLEYCDLGSIKGTKNKKQKAKSHSDQKKKSKSEDSDQEF